MKQIPLTQGQFALVDDSDFDWLNQWKWCVSKVCYGFIARRTVQINGKKCGLKMHRLIVDAPKGMEVDHINHNTLDNRRCNLRLATTSQNQHNQRIRTGCLSKYKGVSMSFKKWNARIRLNGKRIYIGNFSSELDAAIAYDNAAKQLHKEFACLNFG